MELSKDQKKCEYEAFQKMTTGEGCCRIVRGLNYAVQNLIVGLFKPVIGFSGFADVLHRSAIEP